MSATTPAGQEPVDEATARRRYAAALSLLTSGHRDEALKGFKDVVDGFPSSLAADDARVRMALDALDTAHDPAAAEAAATAVVRAHPDGAAAALAYTVLGRVILARGTGAAETDAAVAHFQKVLSAYPEDLEAVPAALVGLADVDRVARRYDEASAKYERVTSEYPLSPWAARAALAVASTLARSGQVERAMTELQRVRLRFPGSAESEQALALNTILYRLHLRTKAGRAAFEFLPDRQPFATPARRGVALGVSPRGFLHLVTAGAISVFDQAGAPAETIASSDAVGLVFDASGRGVIVRQDGLQPMGRDGVVPVFVGNPDSRGARLESITAAAFTSAGDLLIADSDREAIERFPAAAAQLAAAAAPPAPPAKPSPGLAAAPAPFAAVNAIRLAVNSRDEVAALAEGSQSVSIFDRDGRPAGQITPQPRGGCPLQNPVDIAYDALDHLYVVDRDSGTICVLGSTLAPLATYTVAQGAPGDFRRARALALDASGRLFIYDERAQRVQVYR